jgi:hypothetical protein
MTGVLPWVLVGIGGALIIAGVVAGVSMWRNNSRRSPGSRKRHERPREEKEAEVIYCHECGKRAQPGDVFCRTCGTRLRKE